MPTPPTRSPRSRSGRLNARDAGLRRVSIVTRGAIAASVAAATGFTAVAAWAQPGRAKTVTPTRSLGTRGATLAPVAPTTSPPIGVPQTTPVTPAPAGNDDGNPGDGLAPPDTLPTAGFSYSPPVVSGAS